MTTVSRSMAKPEHESLYHPRSLWYSVDTDKRDRKGRMKYEFYIENVLVEHGKAHGWEIMMRFDALCEANYRPRC